jgi:hypothetical protein
MDSGLWVVNKGMLDFPIPLIEDLPQKYPQFRHLEPTRKKQSMSTIYWLNKVLNITMHIFENLGYNNVIKVYIFHYYAMFTK